MKYWNQIAWTLFWSFFSVTVAVAAIGTAFTPRMSLFETIFGLALSLLFGFLACRAFGKRGRRKTA